MVYKYTKRVDFWAMLCNNRVSANINAIFSAKNLKIMRFLLKKSCVGCIIIVYYYIFRRKSQ